MSDIQDAVNDAVKLIESDLQINDSSLCLEHSGWPVIKNTKLRVDWPRVGCPRCADLDDQRAIMMEDINARPSVEGARRMGEAMLKLLDEYK